MSEFVSVALAEEIPPGESRIVRVNGHSVVLCHVEGGDFYAIENVCTHDDGPLGEGTLRGDLIECPRHGALFDIRSGAARTLPAVKPARIFAARVSESEVQIAVDDAS